MTQVLHHYRSFFVAAAALFVGLGSASANPNRVVRGETIEISGEFNFTFWKDLDTYYNLKDGDEQRLLANPKITAPEGFEVTNLELKIRRESHTTSAHPGVRGPQTVYTYDRYVITGRWSVRTSANCADGVHQISISFPEISATAVQLGTGRSTIREPAQSTLTLMVKVFPNRESLEEDKAAEGRMGWGSRIFLIVIWTFVGGCLLFVVITILMIVFGKAAPAKRTPPTPPTFHDEPEPGQRELTPAERDAIIALVLRSRPRL